MTTDAAITVRAIGDGEPQALAALCVRRGAPVLAYCEHVAAPRQAGKAAALAFAQLRANVVAASQTASPIIDLDAELLVSTRRAAAELGIHAISAGADGATDAAIGPCEGLETMLVAQLERPRSDDVRQQHADHIAQCPACTRAMQRLESGQRAFDRPPRAPLPPAIAQQLLLALLAAAPVTALGGDADAVREIAWEQLGNGAPMSNGNRNGVTRRSPTAAVASPLPRPAQFAPSSTAVSPGLAAAQGASDPSPRSRRQVPELAEAGSIGALMSDALAVTRHRMLGPRAGSVERPRSQSRLLRARGTLTLRPADRKRVEFAAVGVFVAVAVLVALVTFTVASDPSSTSTTTAAPPVVTTPAPIEAVTTPAAPATPNPGTADNPPTPPGGPAAKSKAAKHAAAKNPKSSASSTARPASKTRTQTHKQATAPAATRSTPRPASAPPPPPPATASKPKPATGGGTAVPGGDFSTEGDT